VSYVVAHVFAQQEARTTDRLIALGFEVFFPKLKKLIISRGRRRIKIEPVFPTYLIVKQTDDSDQLHDINDTKGVITVLMTANHTPAKLRDESIKAIRAECTRDDVMIASSEAPFRTGERVRPKSGPFAAHVGIFQSMDSRNRVTALFTLLGRETVVFFESGDLVAA
jgi:transcriptional antiterminator RfaH